MFLDRLNPLETMCFDRMPSIPGSRETLAFLFPKLISLSSVPEVLEQFKDASSNQKRSKAQQLRDEAVGLDLTANDLRQANAYWSEMVRKHSLPLGLILKFPRHPLISEAHEKLRRAVDNAFEAYPSLWRKVDNSIWPAGEGWWDRAVRLADEMSKQANERQSAARQLDRGTFKEEILTSIKHVLHLS